MHAVKRIEIIATAFELSKIVDGLRQAQVSGYLVLRNVAGQGLSADTGEEVTLLDNVYVIAFCTPEKLKSAIEIIRPILNKFGGTCFVSDATEIRSMRCVASL
jgi:nitrogen regulatory protein PII